MINYSENDLVAAFENILGNEVVDRMLASNISMPRIHTIVIEKIFLLRLSYDDTNVNLIWHAFIDLQRGSYNYQVK